MVLVHLQYNPSKGEVLVQLPDGSRRWVMLADLKKVAESDKIAESAEVVETQAKVARSSRAKK